jgi:hypothetical protein
MRWPAVFSRPVAAVNSPASFVPGTLVERPGSSCYYLVAVRYCGHGKEGRNAKADDVDRLRLPPSRYRLARLKPPRSARQFRRRPKSSANRQRSFMRCGHHEKEAASAVVGGPVHGLHYRGRAEWMTFYNCILSCSSLRSALRFALRR